MVYECGLDGCGYRSESMDEVLEHETSHFGLTREQYLEWGLLRERVAKAVGAAGITHNGDTEEACDDAIGALLSFEKAHGLDGAEKVAVS